MTESEFERPAVGDDLMPRCPRCGNRLHQVEDVIVRYENPVVALEYAGERLMPVVSASLDGEPIETLMRRLDCINYECSYYVGSDHLGDTDIVDTPG